MYHVDPLRAEVSGQTGDLAPGPRSSQAGDHQWDVHAVRELGLLGAAGKCTQVDGAAPSIQPLDQTDQLFLAAAVGRQLVDAIEDRDA